MQSFCHTCVAKGFPSIFGFVILYVLPIPRVNLICGWRQVTTWSLDTFISLFCLQLESLALNGQVSTFRFNGLRVCWDNVLGVMFSPRLTSSSDTVSFPPGWSNRDQTGSSDCRPCWKWSVETGTAPILLRKATEGLGSWVPAGACRPPLRCLAANPRSFSPRIDQEEKADPQLYASNVRKARGSLRGTAIRRHGGRISERRQRSMSTGSHWRCGKTLRQKKQIWRGSFFWGYMKIPTIHRLAGMTIPQS